MNVKCEICGKSFKFINHLHLRTHNISVKGYREVYPDAELCSLDVRQTMGGPIGKPAWSKGLTMETDIRLAKHSRSLTGRQLSEEHKENISKYLQEHGVWNKGLTKEDSPSIRRGAKKQAKNIKERYAKGEIEPWNKGLSKETDHRVRMYGLTESKSKIGITPECAGWNAGLTKETNKSVAQITKKLKRLWQDPEFKQKKITAMMKAAKTKPNRFELEVESIIQENDLPFEYTGSGEIIIAGLNPDFVCVEHGLIIACYGCYWHGCPEHHPKQKKRYEHSLERVERLEFHGYKVLVVWEHELKDKHKLVKRLKQFVEAGDDV